MTHFNLSISPTISPGPKITSDTCTGNQNSVFYAKYILSVNRAVRDVITCTAVRSQRNKWRSKYRVIFSVLDPRKCEYLKDYSLHFEHAYMTTYLAWWEACRYLFAALWHPDVIGTTTDVWRNVTHSRVIVLCGSEGEWCTQRICGSTWWWRATKRLFSARWSHMPHLEWEHDRNRKLFWWPDYFERLIAAKISWLKSTRFFSCGAP